MVHGDRSGAVGVVTSLRPFAASLGGRALDDPLQTEQKYPVLLEYASHRFDLRFFHPFRADLSIRKSSSFFPPLIAVTSQRGLAPRPAQVSPDGPRYFGGTFLPFETPPPPRAPPTTAILSNCFSSSARCSTSTSSTRLRRSMSASTVIRDRFTFGIVISGGKTVQFEMALARKAIAFRQTFSLAGRERVNQFVANNRRNETRAGVQQLFAALVVADSAETGVSPVWKAPARPAAFFL